MKVSDESIKLPTTSHNSLTPAVNYYGTNMRVKFTGSCLKQPKMSYTYRKIVKIYIVNELGASSSPNNDPTLKNCLFGAATWLKILILISVGILAMELDLIEDQPFNFLVVLDSVKM